jgi:hypothetical protein
VPESRILRTRSITSSISTWLSPAITSSSSSSLGFMARALASSSRFRSGPPKSSAWLDALAPRPTKSSQCRASSLALPMFRSPLAPKSAPTVTLSSTLRSGNGFMIWKVRPMPRRARWYAGCLCSDRPAKRTWPLVGCRVPLTTLISVVLPAPLGPMSPNISPGYSLKLTSFNATSPWKRFVRRSTSSSAVGSASGRFEDAVKGTPADPPTAALADPAVEAFAGVPARPVAGAPAAAASPRPGPLRSSGLIPGCPGCCR